MRLSQDDDTILKDNSQLIILGFQVFNEFLFKAPFTLLRFLFNPLLLMKTLPVLIAPFSNEYAMETSNAHIAPAKRCCEFSFQNKAFC